MAYVKEYVEQAVLEEQKQVSTGQNTAIRSA
jgi:hypothetical protein